MKSKRFGLFGNGFFGDDLFSSMFEDFEKITEQMEREMVENRKFIMDDFDKRTGGQPLVYGFSLTIGPDGKPNLQQFGNAQKLAQPILKTKGKQQTLEREPLVEVHDAGKQLRVIAELPGVDEKSLRIKSSLHDLELKVIDEERPFAKLVKLPAEINPKKTRHLLKNGMLEVILEKK
jgi:HSP20 family protein